MPRIRGRVTTEPRGREGQHRSEPLAPGRDDVGGQTGDQWDRTGHARDDDVVAGVEVVTQQRGERRQRIFAATAYTGNAWVDDEFGPHDALSAGGARVSSVVVRQFRKCHVRMTVWGAGH